MLCSRVRVPHEDEMLLTKPPDSSAGAAARVLRTEQGPEAKLHRGIATKEDKGPLDVCKDAFNSNEGNYQRPCTVSKATRKNENNQSVQSTPGLKAFDARRNFPKCGRSASETTATAISSARRAHAASLVLWVVFCEAARVGWAEISERTVSCCYRSDHRF